MRSGPLIVVYDQGAVDPADIAAGLAPRWPVVFAVDDSEHVRSCRPRLEQLGEVVPVHDLPALRTLRPAGICTFSERMLRPTALLAAGLGLPFEDRATVEVLTDKVRQRDRLRAAGVESVRYAELEDPVAWPDVVARVGLPAVVKPRQGEASRHTHLVDDHRAGQELVDGLLAQTPGLIVEEYLQGRPSLPYGDYVSVESIVRGEEVTHLGVTGKLPLLPPFREVGQFWPARLSESDRRQVVALVDAALAALGVRHSVTSTEVKLTAAGPRIIEVNGRPGGDIHELARRSTGLDLVALVGELAVGGATAVPAAAPDRVFFQYYTPAPVQACTFRGVRGADELGEVEGITGYQPCVAPGSAIAGGVATSFLDIICGVADDHDGMIATLDRVLPRLAYDFRFASGSATFTAAQLSARVGGGS